MDLLNDLNKGDTHSFASIWLLDSVIFSPQNLDERLGSGEEGATFPWPRKQ